MPLFFILFALAVGAYAYGAHRGRQQAQVQAKVGALNPARPPAYYQGDFVFSLPQQRWGRVECLAQAPDGGCRYGVRFPSGNATVLREHEIVR